MLVVHPRTLLVVAVDGPFGWSFIDKPWRAEYRSGFPDWAFSELHGRVKVVSNWHPDWVGWTQSRYRKVV